MKPLKLTPIAVPKPTAEPNPEAAAPAPAAPAKPQGTDRPSYVTMCVRLCDGYYWPVSSPTRPANLRKDSELCESTCAVPAKLYVQYSFGSGPAAMRDLDGKPYKKLKTAFLYRKKFVPECRCRPEAWAEPELARHDEYAMHERTRRMAAELEAEMAAAGAISFEDGSDDGLLEQTAADAEIPPLPLALPVTKDGPNPPAVRVVHLTPAKVTPAPGKPKLAVIKAPPPLPQPQKQPVVLKPAPPATAQLTATKASPGAAGAALTVRKKILQDPRKVLIQHR